MKKLISFKDVTLRLGERSILPGTNWSLHAGEHWAIIGPNGAGKSTLVKALWGGVSVKAGKIDFHFIKNQSENLYEKLRQKIGYVSFELANELVKQERKNAESRDYRGAIHEYTSAATLIGGSNEKREKVSEMLGIEELIDKDIITLSTGESRKMLLARALVKEPELLILDEPFDGLDIASKKNFQELVSSIMKESSTTIVLVTHTFDDIHPQIQNAVMIKSGRIFAIGKRNELLIEEKIAQLFHKKISNNLQIPETNHKSGEVIRMYDVSISYGDKKVINGFNWTVKSGEKWAVLGPNGSGKSSLLKMVTGDHPQAYSNDIWLFGKKRGSGDSIWDIKKRIGYVSADIQLNYQHQVTGLEVILSGLFDSFGLYQRASVAQINAASRLADKLNICQLLHKRYLDCSNGQKRMLILARALIKNPELIILDEPTHGLDISNKREILHILNQLLKSTITLIMVTHHKDEIDERFFRIMEHSESGFIPKQQDV